MGHPPLASRQSHEHFTGLVDADRRRGEPRAEAVGDEMRLAVLPEADGTVGGAEVDADDHSVVRVLGVAGLVAECSRQECEPVGSRFTRLTEVEPHIQQRNRRCVSRMIALLAVGLLAAQNASAVVVDGKDWRQLTDTTGFSWLQVNAACGSGTCSGSIGSVSVDGWLWATRADVTGLFETLIKPDSVQFTNPVISYAAAGDLDIANAVTSVFDPTWLFNLGGNVYREVRGLTRTTNPGGTATMAYLSDSPFLTGIDYAAFDIDSPPPPPPPPSRRTPVATTRASGCTSRQRSSEPEPGTLALFSAGAAAIACRAPSAHDVSARYDRQHQRGRVVL